MAFYNLKSFRGLTLEMIFDWLRSIENETQPQTRAEYLKNLRRIATDLGMTWDPICITRYLAGLLAVAPQPTQAKPMMTSDFRTLKTCLDALTSLSATYTFLTGSRLAETFKILPWMVTRTNARKATGDHHLREDLVIIKVETGKTSKTGMSDPSAMRFTDIAILSAEEYKTLASRLHQDQPVFPSETKRYLYQLLRKMDYSGHSFKRGTARVLSTLLEEGRIQERTIPFFLKHADPHETIPSVTAAYLDQQSRVHVMRAQGIFSAAVELRNRIVGDCYIPKS